MKALDKYKEGLQEIYDYFGFKEDWVIYPIDDRRKYYWDIINGNDQVKYAKSEPDFRSEEHYYINEIYTQRFYKKHVYIGAEYTLIFVDTRTDGMKYFAIYSNDKRLKDYDREE